MKSEEIKKVREELERFDRRLNDYEQRLEEEPWAYQGCKESAAIKRSAMDLKKVLTKNITQYGRRY